MGVRGMVFMSDGESTLHPAWAQAIEYGHNLEMDMAAASNGYMLRPALLDKALPHLTYLRINFGGGEVKRYTQIMGVPAYWFERVKDNIKYAVALKRKLNLGVTLNVNLVLRPQDADQILPFARLGKELGVDYAIIKHCLDYADGPIGVDYAEYEKLQPLLLEAEALSTRDYLVTAKHHMMASGAVKSCRYCYGPQFLLQVSGTGLLAACGPLFAPRYVDKYHIGNVCETRLYDLWQSDRYKEVMNYLHSEEFAEKRVCSYYLCVQRNINEALTKHLAGERIEAGGKPPMHLNFV